jgi:LPS-assembly protein
LIPSVGYSNEGGAEITLPFFWAISENMDATFSLDYRSKRGIGEALEYRYIFSKNSFGNLYFYNMREISSYRDWKKEREKNSSVTLIDRY